MDERDIFIQVIQADDPAKGAALVHELCGEDDSLRQRVESLLDAHGRAVSFLESPPSAFAGNPTAKEPAVERPGMQIGPYKLLQQIGEGGMGTVFMAEQTQPVQRKVALKVIKPGMDSRQVIARFEAERQALAMMDHANIARVLDAGATDFGRPYFVMELVHGVPITKYCDDNHLLPRQRLELFVPVCHAIQHAHQKGIIHRDIKPSNVMVTLYDGKPVPKVIDFGVAKATDQRLTDRTMFTLFGTMVGTLEYMSPEQAEMSALGVDTRSDIYSLGVLLYELLTGSTPLSQKRMKEVAYAELLRVIKEEDPPKPSTRLSESGEALASISAQRHMEPAKLTKLIRGELDWIAMKALEKDRNRRYATANAFAADVQCYLADEAVLACPPSATYRFRKFARKNRTALATAGAIALLLIVGAVVSLWQARRATDAEYVASEQRDAAVSNEQRARSSEVIARQEQQAAIAARDELRRTLYAAEMNLIQAAWEADNVPRVRDLLEGHIPAAGQNDLRGFEWHYWDRLSDSAVNSLQLGVSLTDPQNGTTAISGNGARLVTLVSKGKSFEVQVWDTINGARLNAFALPADWRAPCLQAISPDGSRVAVVRLRGRASTPAEFELRVWECLTGNEVADIQIPGGWPAQSMQLALNADGSRVLTIVNPLEDNPPIDDDASVSQLNVWDVATGKSLFMAPSRGMRVGPALSADGKRAAVLTRVEGGRNLKSPHSIEIWDVESGEQLVTLESTPDERSHHLVFSPDGNRVAAIEFTVGVNAVRVWDAVTGKMLRSFRGRRTVEDAVFNSNGTSLASYSRLSPSVTVWDVTTGESTAVFKGHTEGVFGAAFDADAPRLRTFANDGVVRTWNVPVHHKPDPDSLSFSKRLAVMVINSEGTRIAELHGHGPDAGLIHILDPTGKRLRTITFPEPQLVTKIDNVALNRDGTRMALRWSRRGPGDFFDLAVWDLDTGEIVARLEGEGSSLLAISPDGSQLAIPITSPTVNVLGRKRIAGVKLVDASNGKELRSITLDAAADWCTAIFSPDGKRLATSRGLNPGSDSGRSRFGVQLWDATTGAILFRLPSGALVTATTMAFSPDGAFIAVGSQSSSTQAGPAVIDVWSTATGQKRHTLKGHAEQVRCIVFSRDGSRIVSSGAAPLGDDSDIRVWDAVSGKELTTWSCRGVVNVLAFPRDGDKLIGVQWVSSGTESAIQTWDCAPRIHQRALTVGKKTDP